MIATLRGTVLSKGLEDAVIEAGGIGYEILLTRATAGQLPAVGETAFLHVVQSFGMYGGGESLYGFSNPIDKALFLAFREHVPGAGAKKALEYLDKASKSLPDFKRAIMERDSKLLCGAFGFTKKTAEKLIAALKDNLESLSVPGTERLLRASSLPAADGALSQALEALAALGYKSSEARAALQAVSDETNGKALTAEDVVRLALKKL